jgi:hypothetical protein
MELDKSSLSFTRLQITSGIPKDVAKSLKTIFEQVHYASLPEEPRSLLDTVDTLNTKSLIQTVVSSNNQMQESNTVLFFLYEIGEYVVCYDVLKDLSIRRARERSNDISSWMGSCKNCYQGDRVMKVVSLNGESELFETEKSIFELDGLLRDKYIDDDGDDQTEGNTVNDALNFYKEEPFINIPRSILLSMVHRYKITKYDIVKMFDK